MEWSNDAELFAIMQRELFSAVIADTLDAHGYMHQMLPPAIRPLGAGMRICGRAMPVLECDSVDEQQPYGELFAALDDLKPNEVYVASGAASAYAMWGELMSTAARRRGAAGAILNGYARDTAGILAMNFPVFAWGSYASDQKLRGRALAFRVPVIIGGVTVLPGDILCADEDGVVAVPRAVETEILTAALNKARAEKTLKRDLEAGMLATEAFKRHGIF
jgi:regulator of RNase E activity RraA